MTKHVRCWTLDLLRAHTLESPSDCWVWKRYLRRDGYAQITIAGQNVYGHRVAYELANGPIPPGLVVHHICGRKACLNPAHMALIPQSDHAKLHTPERVAAYQARCLALRES